LPQTSHTEATVTLLNAFGLETGPRGSTPQARRQG
jgi:hypothetical protein